MLNDVDLGAHPRVNAALPSGCASRERGRPSCWPVLDAARQHKVIRCARRLGDEIAIRIHLLRRALRPGGRIPGQRVEERDEATAKGGDPCKGVGLAGAAHEEERLAPLDIPTVCPAFAPRCLT